MRARRGRVVHAIALTSAVDSCACGKALAEKIIATRAIITCLPCKLALELRDGADA